MSRNFIPLVALILLIATVVYLINKPPREPLAPPPLCDDAAYFDRVMDTTLDEPKKALTPGRLSLSDIEETSFDAAKRERHCSATLNVVAAVNSPANRYFIDYGFKFRTDEEGWGENDVVTIWSPPRRTQLPYCDSYDTIASVRRAVLDSMGLTTDINIPDMSDHVAMTQVKEVAFGDAAQKRSCTAGADMSSMGLPGRALAYVISWGDRPKGEIVIDVTKNVYDFMDLPP